MLASLKTKKNQAELRWFMFEMRLKLKPTQPEYHLAIYHY